MEQINYRQRRGKYSFPTPHPSKSVLQNARSTAQLFPDSVTQLEKTRKVYPCERGLRALHCGQPVKATWQLPRGGPLPPTQTKGLSPLLPLPPAKPTGTPVGVRPAGVSSFNSSFLSRLPTWKEKKRWEAALLVPSTPLWCSLAGGALRVAGIDLTPCTNCEVHAIQYPSHGHSRTQACTLPPQGSWASCVAHCFHHSPAHRKVMALHQLAGTRGRNSLNSLGSKFPFNCKGIITFCSKRCRGKELWTFRVTSSLDKELFFTGNQTKRMINCILISTQPLILPYFVLLVSSYCIYL